MKRGGEPKLIKDIFGQKFKAERPEDYIDYTNRWADRVKAEGDYTPPEEKIKPIKYPEFPDRLNEFDPDKSESLKWDMKFQFLKRELLNNRSFVLCGNRSVGKSVMGVSLIKHCCSMGKSGCYTTLYEMHADITENIKNRRIFTIPYLLVIDACEVRHGTDAEERNLNYVFDTRHSNKKSTILITNDRDEVLNELLGDSITERIRETGGKIKMNWGSLRVK